MAYPGIKHLSLSLSLYTADPAEGGSGAQGLPRSGFSPRNSASPRAQHQRGDFFPAACSVGRDTAIAGRVAGHCSMC